MAACFVSLVDGQRIVGYHTLASAFYCHHGFIALPYSPLTLFLPLATVLALAPRKAENKAR